MPIVVSNSSPIINLAIIKRLDLLKKIWGKIYVPEIVWQEVVVEGGDREEVNDIKKADWIIVENVKDQNLVLALNQNLDKGEAGAIALAVEKKADIILLDETDARAVADIYNLTKTGVLGILIRAKLDGEIVSLKEEIKKLRVKANFWLKESLINQILKKVEEAH